MPEMQRESNLSDKGMDLEYVSCNLCGGRESRLIYSKPDTRYWVTDQEFNAVQCNHCKLGYVNPRPTFSASKLFYPEQFYQRRGVPAERSRYDIQAEFLEGLSPGKVLDIGCAGGSFLKVLQERGWEVFGMDSLTSGGNEYNIPIKYGELPDLRYPSNHFDVITSWAVFEHLHDPKAYFTEVGRILKPGGHFICLVTNLNSLWSRFSYCEDIPRHLYFFTAKTLREYAKLASLHLAKIDYSTNLFPPDSTDVFRVQVLRRWGFSWREIYAPSNRLPFLARFVSRVTRLLGVLFIWPRMEAIFRVRGIMVAVLKKK